MSTDDIVAIQQLVARYNMAIDDGDGDEFAATFTEVGELVIPDATFSGREALATMGASAKEREVQVRHWVNSQHVTVTGDVARSRSNLLVLRVGADGPHDAPDGPLCRRAPTDRDRVALHPTRVHPRQLNDAERSVPGSTFTPDRRLAESRRGP